MSVLNLKLPELPPEILVLVCDQLEYQRDFKTLLACARTGRFLGEAALQRLYRIYPHSTIFGRVGRIKENFGCPRCIDYPIKIVDSQLDSRYFPSPGTLPQRKKLLKTILSSSIGKTVYPYSLYLQSLDLRLSYFRGSTCSYESYVDIFFEPELTKLAVFKDKKNNYNTQVAYLKRERQIDVLKTSELIGETVLFFISEEAKRIRMIPNLKRLTWHNDGATLTKWISQLPNLKSLAISSKNSSNLQDLAKAISDHCPKFEELSVIVNFQTSDEYQDEILSQFLRGLKRNTLRKFVAFSGDFTLHRITTGMETLLSLNHHADSLTTLKFGCLDLSTLRKLPLLRTNKGLTSLQLSFSDREELQVLDQDLFEACVGWVYSCHSLCELSVGHSLDGTAIASRICGSNWIRLQKLEILRLKFTESEEFFRSLRLHTTLEYLHLEGDIKSHCRIASKNLLETIPHLTNLKFLDITTSRDNRMMSGGYSLRMITALVKNLSKLEEFTFSCTNITDDIWPIMTKLRHLRALNILGPSKFTYEGILAYINSLYDTNKGLELLVMTHKSYIGLEDIITIRNFIHYKVGGNFQMRDFPTRYS